MTLKEFLVLPAGNKDIPAIKKIVFSVLREYGLSPDESGKDNDLNDIEKNYFAGNGFFGIVVEIETNDIVGTFGLFPAAIDTYELRKMYLLKQARGRGAGTLILNTCTDIARENHYKKITLETISVLKEAVSLYKKFGFTEIAPVEINERVDQAFELYVPAK